MSSSNPNLFAAIVPICGYLSDHRNLSTSADPSVLETIVEGCKSIPTWTFHSSSDVLVPVSHTDTVVEALNEAGVMELKYTRYDEAPDLPNFQEKGKGHACYELSFREHELYEWLLKRQRTEDGQRMQEGG